jgi:hypothetical protein
MWGLYRLEDIRASKGVTRRFTAYKAPRCICIPHRGLRLNPTVARLWRPAGQPLLRVKGDSSAAFVVTVSMLS